MQSAPSSGLQGVFFNQRSLRAGWRLLIFAGILYALNKGFLLVIAYLQGLARQSAPGGAVPRPDDLQILLPILEGMIEFLKFAVVLLLSWMMSRLERRNVGEYGFPLTQSAPIRYLATGVLLGFLLLSVTLLVLRGLHVFYFGGLALHGSQILVWGVLWGFAFLGVAFYEECLFRGYALFTLADGIGFWPAAVIMAMVFGRAHMSNGGENHLGILGTILFAMVASATLRRTGSLWLAVGAHAGWDWGQSFFFGVSDSGFQAPGHLLNPQIQGPAWLSGGTAGPEGSVVTLIVLALMTVGFLAFYRNRRAAAVLVITEADRTLRPSF